MNSKEKKVERPRKVQREGHRSASGISTGERISWGTEMLFCTTVRMSQSQLSLQQICVPRSPSWYPLCSLHINLVQHSRSRCLHQACRQILTHSALSRWLYGILTTTIRCVSMGTIQPSHLNKSMWHRALEAAVQRNTFRLSFQCIKGQAIITFTATFLSYP